MKKGGNASGDHVVGVRKRPEASEIGDGNQKFIVDPSAGGQLFIAETYHV